MGDSLPETHTETDMASGFNRLMQPNTGTDPLPQPPPNFAPKIPDRSIRMRSYSVDWRYPGVTVDRPLRISYVQSTMTSKMGLEPCQATSLRRNYHDRH